MAKTSVVPEVEYGKIGIGSLTLESGEVLPNVEIAYERTGPEDAPVVFVCHALTGNQYTIGDRDQPGWWSGLIGDEKSIDTSRWQVVTMNVLGGCNGSTGPQSVNPESNLPYRTTFPFVTVRDIVHAHYRALTEMGINRLKAAAGASLGGMQVLEWGLLYPDFIEKLLPIAVTPYLSDYAIAYNAIARNAIQNDPNWKQGDYDAECPPAEGLGIARMVGMITYRSAGLYNERFSRKQYEGWGSGHSERAFEVESYLSHQGKKLSERFDANSYLYLLKAMDSHDIGHGRGGWERALDRLRVPLYAFGFCGDLLYPPQDVKTLTKGGGHFYEVDTNFGHDGFLVQFEKWGWRVRACLDDD
jgi:homoserine O-acetyltransferase